MRIIRSTLQKIFIVTQVVLLAAGCSRDRGTDPDQSGMASLYLSVSSASRTINEDEIYWEDRVDELRLIAFDSGTGDVVLNQKLYFPDGFSGRSRPVKMTPGNYDLYFFANETVYQDTFAQALMEVTNVAEFTSQSRFDNILWYSGFQPDGDSVEGRFLMSAVYNNINIAAGGTEANPLPLPLPTAKVELVRAMAKVQVVFRKRVPGSNVPSDAVTSVQLSNVAARMSVPPSDDWYTGFTTLSDPAPLDNLDYTADSIGSVIFYIPEYLMAEGSGTATQLVINNKSYPIENDTAFSGLTAQRRNISGLSTNSVIRNYQYIVNAYINAEGGIQIRVVVEPWTVDNYIIIFEGDQQIVIPPVIPTDSSIIIPTECGKVEILSDNEYLTGGLQDAYGDVVYYYYPPTGASDTIVRGDPPFYCEVKYGPGWRLINSCELLSFLGYFDAAYTVWLSNTWLARTHDVPYYSLPFRQEAQYLLEKLTGKDLSATVLYNTNNNQDQISDDKLDIIDEFFTPGDIMIKEEDYPNGWPYEASPGARAPWIYNEVVIQMTAFWYGADYYDLSIRENWDKVLYQRFQDYNFSGTVSRCVRPIN